MFTSLPFWLLVGMALSTAYFLYDQRKAARAISEEPDDLDAAVIERVPAGSRQDPHEVAFFLYFPREDDAQRAAEQIRAAGFDVKVERAAAGDNWLCLATKTMPLELETLQRIRSRFTALAASLGGEYDGWGTSVAK